MKKLNPVSATAVETPAVTAEPAPRVLSQLTTIGEYLNTYGNLIGEQAQSSLNPLHIPSVHAPLNFSDIKRAPLPAQAHAITACVKQLKRDRSCFLIGEQGTGKSLMGICTAHNLARSATTGLVDPYRAIIMCPPHLTHKWEREIRMTISGSEVIQLRHVRQLMVMRNHSSASHEPTRMDKPTSFEWWIVKENTAKHGASWRPAFNHRPHENFARCATCGEIIANKDGVPIPASDFDETLSLHQYTPGNGNAKTGCMSQLWTFCRNDSGRALWAIAKYARTHLKRFFDVLICDEAHENRGRESARAIAMSQLSAASKCSMQMTGSFAGGYAWQIRTLLMRTAPQSLIREGISWKDETKFNEMYGRIETKIITSGSSSESANRTSQGKSRTTRKSVKPGIMPTLFGRHMIDKSVFLSLDEMVSNLPLLTESVTQSIMDPDVAKEYTRIESTLRAAIAEMLQKGDKRLLGSMLRVLLTYPDHPYGFETIGYTDNGFTPDGIPTSCFVPVVTPADLSPDYLNPNTGKLQPRAKEQALLDLLISEHKAGRQCWVYVQDTQKYDIQPRLQELIEERGMTCRILRANTVSTEDREDWIEEYGASTDVMISHPQLVQTGLDLFSQKRGLNGEISGHNFSTIIFFETGYDSFVLRQAARRAWRIGQSKHCKVIYFYYTQSMQHRAMTLMGKKISTSNAIEGKFTDGGLSALGDDVDSIEIELARSLSETFDDSVTQRSWTRISGNSTLSESGLHSINSEVDSINESPTLTKRSMFSS